MAHLRTEAVTDADVARHFPLVRFVIGRMRGRGQLLRHLELDDIEAVGRMAVWDALRRWDPAKGAQSTYLSAYIWGYVMRYQRDVSKATGWNFRKGTQLATVTSLDAPVSEGGLTLHDVLAEQGVEDERLSILQLLDAATRIDDPRRRVVAAHLLLDSPTAAAGAQLGLKPSTVRKLAAQVRDELA